MKVQFAFDSPTGTYKSPSLAALLEKRADKFGPFLALYGPVAFKALDGFCDPASATLTVLVYQLRHLRRLFPGVRPELRACVPGDFGRSMSIAWYDPRFEGTLLAENFCPGVIQPEDVL